MSEQATTAPPWWAGLEDSVDALGTAAREYERAVRALALLGEGADLDRVRVHGGVVAAVRAGEADRERLPHDAAVFWLAQAYADLEQQARRRFADAAYAYAYGAAWAVRQVRDGYRPARVRLAVSEEGVYLPGMPPTLRDVGGPEDAAERARAWEALEACLSAQAVAQQINRLDDVGEEAAVRLHRALTTASGLGEAALWVGRCAEDALQDVLRQAKRSPGRAVGL